MQVFFVVSQKRYLKNVLTPTQEYTRKRLKVLTPTQEFDKIVYLLQKSHQCHWDNE